MNDTKARFSLVKDQSTWDLLVQAHREGGFLQSWGWGHFKRHFGWAPVHVRLPSSEEAPAPVAQVLFRRLPYSPVTVGYVPRGPLLDYRDEIQLDAMARALDRLAYRYHAVSITWELPVADDPALRERLLQRKLRPTRPVQTRSTRVIDLSPSLEAIQAAQKPKWRSNTRLAERHGVRVRQANSLDDFVRWYALLRTTSERDGFTVRDEAYYRRFWQERHEQGDTVLFLAEHDGAILAGIMVHRFGQEATYLYGASGDQGRNLMPNHALQWTAMQWAKAHGATRYDMFGIADTDDSDEPLAGITRFKAGWGGEAVRFAGAFDRVYNPLLYTALQRMRGGSVD